MPSGNLDDMSHHTTPNHLPAALVREFAAEMGRQGIRRSAVADALGMSRSSLTRKLNGDTALTVGDAAAIARCLHHPLSDLLRAAEWAMDGTPRREDVVA